MNLHDAAHELRSLDLPALRARQLVMEAAHSPSDAARELLVSRARYEALEGDRRHQDALKADHAARWALAQERAAHEPQPVAHRPVVDDRSKDGPVRISWTTPRKPDLIRTPRRAEVIGANRKPAEKEVPQEILQVVEGVTVADIKHGIRGYNVHKCRCVECKQAKRDSRNPERKPPRSTETVHGTLGTYVREKCRCKPCRAASSEYNRARYAARKALKEENTK